MNINIKIAFCLILTAGHLVSAKCNNYEFLHIYKLSSGKVYKNLLEKKIKDLPEYWSASGGNINAVFNNLDEFSWGNETGIQNVTQIQSTGPYTVYLRENGEIVQTGNMFWINKNESAKNKKPWRKKEPDPNKKYIQIDVGGNFSTYQKNIALTEDGKVEVWGDGKGSSGLTDIIKVKSTDAFYGALSDEGKLNIWGETVYSSYQERHNKVLNRIPAIDGKIVDFDFGHFFVLALLDNGKVIAWGDNSHGQCSVPIGLKNIKKIAAGGITSYALSEDGEFFSWGFLSREIEEENIVNVEDFRGYGHSSASSDIKHIMDGIVVLRSIKSKLPIISGPEEKINEYPLFSKVDLTFNYNSIHPITYSIFHNEKEVANGEQVEGDTVKYIFDNFNKSDAGEYYVVIKNKHSSTRSNKVNLQYLPVTPAINFAQSYIAYGKKPVFEDLVKFEINASGNKVRAPENYEYEFTPPLSSFFSAGRHSTVFRFIPEDTGQFNMIEKTLNFTIQKAPLSLKVGEYESEVYGDWPDFDITVDGLVEVDSPDFIKSLVATPDLDVNSQKPGTYSITITGDVPNAIKNNYHINYVKGKFILKYGPPIVKFNTNVIKKKVDDALNLEPSIQGPTVTGIVWYKDGDQLNNFTIPKITKADEGKYWVVVKSDYGNTKSEVVTLTVEPVEPNLAWNPMGEKQYGDLITGDDYDIQSPVEGTYDYDPSIGQILKAVGEVSFKATFTANDTDNYLATTIVKRVEVSKTDLLIKASDVSRPYGMPNPEFKLSYVGFVSGDNPEQIVGINIQTEADLHSPIGTYNVSVSGGQSVNYNITHKNGILKVINGKPVIAYQSDHQVVEPGATVLLSPTVSGVSPMSYQWFRDGELMPLETNRSLLLEGVKPVNSGSYNVKISNQYGEAQGDGINVLVTGPPVVSADYRQLKISVGGDLNIDVSVSGMAPVYHQWYKNGKVIQEATSSSLTIQNAKASDAGDYRLVASNSYGQTPGPTISVQLIKDSDLDGLEDSVEIDFLGTNPNSKDTDKDGFDDLLEVRAGSDPTNAKETPGQRIKIHTAVELEFFTLQGKRYQLQVSQDLDSWIDFLDPIVGEGSVKSILVPTRNGIHQYWRLISL
jgi:hypothetical protein